MRGVDNLGMVVNVLTGNLEYLKTESSHTLDVELVQS